MSQPVSQLVPLHEAAVLAGMNERALRAYVAAGKAKASDEGGALSFTKAAIDEIAAVHRKSMEAARRMSMDDLVGELALLRMTVESQEAELANIAERAAGKSVDTSRLDELVDSLRGEHAGLVQSVAKIQRAVEETIVNAQTALQQDMGKMFSTVGNLSEEIATMQRTSRGGDPDPSIKELERRAALQETGSAEIAQAVQTLLGEAENTRANLEALAKQNQKLRASLLVALDAGTADAADAPIPVSSPLTAVPAPRVVEEKPSEQEESPKLKAAQARVEEQTQPRSASTETPVKTPVKSGIKREIEFNYLLQRMEYKRLDAYSPDELEHAVVPEDAHIRAFLGKFELGCPEDEVAIVNLQRGDYHMIQYQRVDKSSRAWMPNRKK